MENKQELKDELQSVGKRNFLNRTIIGMGAFGVGSFLWMLTRAANTPTEIQTAGDLKIDLSQIRKGETKTFAFKGSPLSVRHRTNDEMAQAERLYGPGLRDPYANNQLLHEQDPATNANRSIAGKAAYIAVISTCTHTQKCTTQPNMGDFKGWFCPCCSTHYDLAGRVIKGIAPRNLKIPRYQLANNNILHILS